VGIHKKRSRSDLVESLKSTGSLSLRYNKRMRKFFPNPTAIYWACLIKIVATAPALAKAPHDILFYFNQFKKDWKTQSPNSNLTIRENSSTPNSLVAEGEFDGYLVLKLFHGEKKDYLIEQNTGCGPECEQRAFQVTVFQDGRKSESRELEPFYPKDRVDEFLKNQKKKLKKVEGQELTPWLYLSPNEPKILVLLLGAAPGAGENKARVYEVGVLTWQGNAFDFKTNENLRPSSLKLEAIR